MTNSQLTTLKLIKYCLTEAGVTLGVAHTTNEEHHLSKALEATNKLIRDFEYELWSASDPK